MGKGDGNMTLFDSITQSPETLAEYLAADKDNQGCIDCNNNAECTGKEYCKQKWLEGLNSNQMAGTVDV